MKVSSMFVGLAIAWAAEAVLAQTTTVQLPTYRSFSVSTAVSVPDRGSAYLGGVNRAQSGMNEFGSPLSPFRSRAFGSQRSASGVSVSAYIHDFDELEKELLSRPGGSGRNLTTLRSPDGTTRAVVPSERDVVRSPDRERAGVWSPDRTPRVTEGLLPRGGDLRSMASAGSGDPRRAPLPSIEEIRRQRLADQEARQAEAEEFVERGRAAEESGKMNVARMYYQMAAKRASGALKDEVLAKLDSLRREPPPKVARREP